MTRGRRECGDTGVVRGPGRISCTCGFALVERRGRGRKGRGRQVQGMGKEQRGGGGEGRQSGAALEVGDRSVTGIREQLQEGRVLREGVIRGRVQGSREGRRWQEATSI